MITMSNSQLSFASKPSAFPLVHYGRSNDRIFHFHLSHEILHGPSRSPYSIYRAQRGDLTHEQIKSDLLNAFNSSVRLVKNETLISRKHPKQPENVAVYACSRHKACRVRFRVKRTGGKFGYYKSSDDHNHATKPNIVKEDKFNLPSPVKLMCLQKYKEKRASTEIMCHLHNISASPVKVATFGPKLKNIMATKEGANAMRKKGQRACHYHNETKRISSRNSDISRRRTYLEVIDDFKLRYVSLQELFDRFGASLNMSELCSQLAVPDISEWSYFYTHSDIEKSVDLAYSTVQWINKATFSTARNAIDMCEMSGIPIMFLLDYTFSDLPHFKNVLGIVIAF